MSYYHPLSEFDWTLPGKKKYHRLPVVKTSYGLRYWFYLIFNYQKVGPKAATEIMRYNVAVKKFNNLPAFKSCPILLKSYQQAVNTLYGLEQNHKTPTKIAKSLDYNRQMAAYLSNHLISDPELQLLPRNYKALKKLGLTNCAELAAISIKIPGLGGMPCTILLRWRYAIEKKFTYVADPQFIAKEIERINEEYPVQKSVLIEKIDQHMNDVLTSLQTLRAASLAFEEEFTAFRLKYKSN